MRISLSVDLSGAIEKLNELERKQVPFATTLALTKTAKLTQVAEEREIATIFDRPKPFTLRSVFIRPATRKRPWAEVALKGSKDSAGVSRDSSGSPVRTLFHHTEGGARALKPFENLLQARGLMPQGWYAVAGNSIPRDQYGNVPSGIINRVLSQLQAHSAYQLERNETAKSRARQFKSKTKRLQRYFVVRPGNPRLIPGIWERTSFGFGSSIRPLFIYVQRAPRYSKRWRFDEIVKRTVELNFESQFKTALQHAIATAKSGK